MEFIWGNLTQVINTQSEYDSIVLKKSTLCPPKIDFLKHSLLGQHVTAKSCLVPDYKISVMKDDVQKEINYRLRIIQYGYCDIARFSYKWILIPKIPNSYKVVFEKEFITRELF